MKQRFSRREIFFLIFAATALVVMLTAFIAMNAAVARGLPGGGDILLHWKGARAIFFEKAEPYSGATASFVQQRVYGHDAQPGEKPYILDIPMDLLLLYFPLSAVEAELIARAIFLFVSECSLLALILLGLRITDWQPRRLYLILIYLISAVSFYSLGSMVEGSPALILGLLCAGVLLALRAGSDELAGFLLAPLLQRWEIGGTLVLLVLFWVLAQRRWRVVSGLFMALFILNVVAFFVYPGWITPFLRANLANAQWTYGFTPAVILARYWPEYGKQAGLVVSVILWVLLLTEWIASLRGDYRRLFWAACLGLAASPLLGWRGEIQNLAILLLPLIFILSIARERWRAGYWLSGALLLLVTAVPWWLLLGDGVPVRMQQDLLFLFLPAFCVLGMYWIRWWALRPARTWFDRVSLNEYR